MGGFMEYLIVISALIGLLTVIMGVMLFKKSGTNLDLAVQNWVKTHDNELLMSIMKRVTLLGNVETLMIINIPILFVLIRDYELVTATAIVMSAGLATVITQGLKLAFRRIRPVRGTNINYIGYSFPSGHSAVGTSFYITLAYISSSGLPIMPFVVLSGIVMGLMISFSRIYIGVHWTTDVIVGLIIGLICAVWSIYLFEHHFILEFIFKYLIPH